MDFKHPLCVRACGGGSGPAAKVDEMFSVLMGLTRVQTATTWGRVCRGWACAAQTMCWKNTGTGELSGLGSRGVHWEILMFGRKKPQAPPQFSGFGSTSASGFQPRAPEPASFVSALHPCQPHRASLTLKLYKKQYLSGQYCCYI